MSKIAVVGCQASGKTVFTAALADYYRPNQRVNQLCCMTPENANANRFSEMMIHQMRDLHEWPSATNAQRTMSLKWAMRRDREVIAQIEMLDFGGEVFRAAFRDDEGTPQNQDAVRQLVDHLIDANFIVVLVSLAEIARDINHTATDQDVVLDAESKWVTRGLLDLLKEHQSSGTKVIVALSQADRPEHKQLLEAYGGAKELFEKAWPTVSAVYPDLTVISVASVSSTTMDNRPADGFKTDGVLSVMKEFVQSQFGDCDGTASRLAAAANELKSMAAVPSPAVFTRKLNEFDKLLQQLYKDTAVISELYKREFQEYEKVKATCLQFVDVIADVERRPLDSQVNSTFWREQEQLYPILAGSIRSFERYYQRKVEQQREEARKQEEARQAEIRRQEEAAARAAAEHARMIKQQEEERQLRIKLEAEASARHKREMEEQERKDELERIRRRDAILAKKEEERIAAEKAKREEEEKRLEAERLAKERASKAKSFFVRMIAIGLVLAAIAGITFYYYSDKQAKDRAKEIELYNSRKEQEQRIAKQNAEENARRAESERRRAEAEAERAKAESDARIAQAKADEEKAKAARAEKEAEQARQQAAQGNNQPQQNSQPMRVEDFIRNHVEQVRGRVVQAGGESAQCQALVTELRGIYNDLQTLQSQVSNSNATTEHATIVQANVQVLINTVDRIRQGLQAHSTEQGAALASANRIAETQLVNLVYGFQNQMSILGLVIFDSVNSAQNNFSVTSSEVRNVDYNIFRTNQITNANNQQNYRIDEVWVRPERAARVGNVDIGRPGAWGVSIPAASGVNMTANRPSAVLTCELPGRIIADMWRGYRQQTTRHGGYWDAAVLPTTINVRFYIPLEESGFARAIDNAHANNSPSVTYEFISLVPAVDLTTANNTNTHPHTHTITIEGDALRTLYANILQIASRDSIIAPLYSNILNPS